MSQACRARDRHWHASHVGQCMPWALGPRCSFKEAALCVQACMGLCAGPWPLKPGPLLLYTMDTRLTSKLGPTFLPSLTPLRSIHTAPHPPTQTWTCVHTRAHMCPDLYACTHPCPHTNSCHPSHYLSPPCWLSPPTVYTLDQRPLPVMSTLPSPRSALTLKCCSHDLLTVPSPPSKPPASPQRESLSVPPHPRGPEG